MIDPREPHPSRDNGAHGSPGFWRSKAGWATIGFLVVAIFLIVSEHRAHALGALPYLLLIACPAMHFFMHGGHDGHGRSEQGSDRPTQGG